MMDCHGCHPSWESIKGQEIAGFRFIQQREEHPREGDGMSKGKEVHQESLPAFLVLRKGYLLRSPGSLEVKGMCRLALSLGAGASLQTGISR